MVLAVFVAVVSVVAVVILPIPIEGLVAGVDSVYADLFLFHINYCNGPVLSNLADIQRKGEPAAHRLSDFRHGGTEVRDWVMK